MNIRYLLTWLLVGLVGFNSCGDKEDIPDPNGQEETEILKVHTLVINVEEAGTLEGILKEQGPVDMIFLDFLVIEGNLNWFDIMAIPDISPYPYPSIPKSARPILDLSKVNIVESTGENGQTYLANHWYGASVCGLFNIKYPRSIEVYESGTVQGGIVEIEDMFDNVREIGDRCFTDTYLVPEKNEVELVFPPNLKRIGKGAFAGVPWLKKITTSSDVVIEESAFYGSNLEYMNLKGVKEIGKFQMYDKLVEVSMPDVTEIGDSAFYIVADIMNALPTSVSMPNVKYIGEYAFEGREVDIKAEDLRNVVELKKGAFEGNLITVDISQAINLTTIGYKALGGYLGDIYDEMIIPENVKTMANRITENYFYNVHMRCKEPPRFQGGADRAFICDTLYVPRGCKAIYEEGALPESGIFFDGEYRPNAKRLSCGIIVGSGVVLEE